MSTEMISITEAAQRLSVDPVTIRRLIQRGELRAYKAGPRLVRIDPQDLQSFMRPIEVTKP